MRGLALVIAAQALWPFSHVYVANLERDYRRAKRMHKTLAGLGMKDFEMFHALDGLNSNEVSRDRVAAMHKTSQGGDCGGYTLADAPSAQHLRPWGPHEQEGATGCYLTHLSILKDAERKKYDSVLIAEDDLDPARDAMRGPTELTGLPETWDMVYLGWSRHLKGVGRHTQRHAALGGIADGLSAEECSPVKNATSICRVKAPVLQQTHALMVHRKAFRPLITLLEHGLSSDSACAIDQMYKGYLGGHPEFQVFAMTTPLFLQRTAEGKEDSDIVLDQVAPAAAGPRAALLRRARAP